ncbi:thioredoxin domain-containing protein [Nocardia colli]|uniref:hypothetical protein n=1 Tax=Nocardia colli TaxID=2545717 RepID=UPI00168D06A6|nr:hypothetical protein [Nocardia colli]
MPYVVAAVVVLAVLVVLNLLLTFAVLRRLRIHEERLATPGATRPSDRDQLIGRRLPQFEATGANRLVAFFSAGCAPCVEQAAEFARHPDPDRVAILVLGLAPEAERERLRTALGDAPTVIGDPTGDALAGELGVHSFPQLLLLDQSGTIVAARHSLAALAAGVS